MLRNHTWEIYSIAKANNADIGVARDMFVANLNKGQPIEGQDWYAGADADFEILGAEWNALSAEEQTADKNAFSDFLGRHYASLAAAWKAEDKLAFGTLVVEAE